MQTFRRTFHANPQHSALRGTRAWKVILLKGYLQAISPTEGPGRQVGKFPTLHVRKTGRCHRGAGTTAINWTSTAIDNSIGVFASLRVPCTTCRKALCQLPKGLVLFSEALYHMPECFVALWEHLDLLAKSIVPLPDGLLEAAERPCAIFGSSIPHARMLCATCKSAMCYYRKPYATCQSALCYFRKPYAKTFGERCALQGPLEGVVSPNAAKSASLVSDVPCRPL